MSFQIGLFLWDLQEIRGMVHESVFAEKSFEQIGIAMAYVYAFLSTMHEIDTAAEMYLEPFLTYIFELVLQK